MRPKKLFGWMLMVHHKRTPGASPSTFRWASQSTATFDDAVIVEGSDTRQKRLDERLRSVGFDPSELHDDRLAGSAAVRTYRSFVLPKSEKARAIADQPQRAATVAAQISYLARETIAKQTTWLVNRDTQERRTRHPVTIILDGLRSGENVGNILRTAETAGASVIACGTTPRPPHPAVLKAACNAAEKVDFHVVPDARTLVTNLQNQNVTVWALETTTNATSLFDMEVEPKSSLALVFGNELMGISPDVITLCDATVAIPTFGTKNSLNVASAVAVTVFEVLRQWY